MAWRDAVRKWLGHAVPVKPVRLRLARGIVSFTFDDFPASAARKGAAILEGAGVRGTFYASAATMGRSEADFDAADARRLSECGHEIGCHTFSHRRCFRIGLAELNAEWRQNRERLAEMSGIAKLESFAYPFGACDLASKRAASRSFATARGIRPGVHGALADFAELKGTSLGPAPERKARALDLIGALAEKPGWVVFYTHDVSREPSPHGCHEDTLREIVQAAVESGLDVLTVKAAARTIRCA